MNKLEFIDHYCGDMSIEDKEEFMRLHTPVPCACNEPGCLGWSMLILDERHVKTYGDLYAIRPNTDTVWVHDKTGNEYTVVGFANLNSTKPDYPPTIIYKGSDGEQWCRPLSRWFIGMTPKATN